MAGTYDHLLKTLAKAQEELDVAKGVANELARDHMLPASTRNTIDEAAALLSTATYVIGLFRMKERQAKA